MKRKKRKIKPLLDKLTENEWEEKGELLPLEIANLTDEEIVIKHTYWRLVHKNKMAWQKVLKHYRLKEYRYSRKSFRRNRK